MGRRKRAHERTYLDVCVHAGPAEERKGLDQVELCEQVLVLGVGDLGEQGAPDRAVGDAPVGWVGGWMSGLEEEEEDDERSIGGGGQTAQPLTRLWVGGWVGGGGGGGGQASFELATYTL